MPHATTRIGSFADVPRTIVDGLCLGAARRPEAGITLLDNRGRPAEFRAFPTLLEAIALAAGRHLAMGVRAGDRVIVCLPTSWEWIEVWFGALWMGAWPVAIAPPGAMGSPLAQIERALRVAGIIGARFLVAPPSFVKEAEALIGADKAPSSTRLIDVAAWQQITAQSAPAAPKDSEEVAFLQLTSGSTGLPRAVEITHRAAVHNTNAIIEILNRGAPYHHAVSWLPLYHDMGLIGTLMTSFFAGIPLDLLTPRSFLARPHVWLEAISRRSDVLSVAPNFAYRLCVERVDAKAANRLDLSSWVHIATGSEMISPETIGAFVERFRPQGVLARHLRPCYGLAETTLCVTLDSRNEGLRSAAARDAQGNQIVVACDGVPVLDTELRITGDGGDDLPHHEVGRVLVRSPGLMRGYYNDVAATREVLIDGWLDTGDLGFVDEHGDLFITGRRKEILIVRGLNLMPHELEWRAEQIVAGGGSQRSGAFSIASPDGEAAVLVVETTEADDESLAEIEHLIRSDIGRNLGLPLADVVFVRRGSIPRTSSGKVQRRALRDDYLRDELARLTGPHQRDTGYDALSASLEKTAAGE